MRGKERGEVGSGGGGRKGIEMRRKGKRVRRGERGRGERGLEKEGGVRGGLEGRRKQGRARKEGRRGGREVGGRRRKK